MVEGRVLTDKDATCKGILEVLEWLKSRMTPKDVGILSRMGSSTSTNGMCLRHFR